MKAAAKGYFGKKLEDLTLAQYAILAAIPQSPTRFDLIRNAEEVCLDEVDPEAPPADGRRWPSARTSSSSSRTPPRSSSAGTTSWTS